MKILNKRFLAAKIACVLTLTAVPNFAPATGIPTVDLAAIAQSALQYREQIAQTLKQIQQYQTQLQQYENMLRNTVAPAANIWDAATNTMNQLRSAIDTVSYYRNNLGNIDAYLNKFKDTAGYRNSPCYSPTGCSAAEWTAMKDSEKFGYEAQKRANDALFLGLNNQINALQSDARQLERLQSAAQGANGQLEAIGYANQLASNQSNQLLQIRGLLIAQQNVIATRNQALADREAKEQAAASQLRTGTYRPSPTQTW